jgi:hypothetical protein
MLIAPGDEILFGDIFEASYLFDVHLADDAARMGRGEFPPVVQQKYGTTDPLYSTGLPVNDDIVRAHGRSGREREGRKNKDTLTLPGRAILLSDDCHIPTAYGDRPGRERDRTQARGRLMFASLIDATDDQIAEIAGDNNYGRFAIPAHALLGKQPAIAELRRPFTVHARAVDPAHRLASLEPDVKRRLETRWNAFSCRRGPEAARTNAQKLGKLLQAGEEPGSQEKEAAQLVGTTLVTAWDLEGSVMRSVSLAQERGESGNAEIEALSRQLQELAALADTAANKIATLLAERSEAHQG